MTTISDELRRKLKRFQLDFEQNHPKLARIYKDLRKNPKILEEATIGTWDLTFEE